MKSKAAALAAVGLLACSSSKVDAPPDASNNELRTGASARAVATFAALARFPSLENHLGRGGTLTRAEEGFRAQHLAPSTAIAGGASFATTLPLRANGAVHVARADRHDVFVDVSSEVEAVSGEAVEGAVVYPGAAPETDVVQIVESTRVEELRVLHGPRAGRSFTWSLRPGPAITELRLREGRVEALEGDAIRIVSEPIVAIDSKGVRREAKVTLTKNDGSYRLSAELSLDGLAFPVALDPGWTITFGHLSQVHDSFQAVRLNDGRVAALPGAVAATLKVDIYDPVTDKFSLGPPVSYSRYNSAAIRLGSSNKILIVGGNYSPYNAQYEIWDSTTGTSGTKPLPFVMNTPTLTVLPSGKIFGTT
ncbi:MAG: hypothetical protein ACXWUG_29430, partial [Polyangiales bacterium]